MFDGNTDSDHTVYNRVNPPIETRYIRILPVQWEINIGMRIELYGCDAGILFFAFIAIGTSIFGFLSFYISIFHLCSFHGEFTGELPDVCRDLVKSRFLRFLDTLGVLTAS